MTDEAQNRLIVLRRLSNDADKVLLDYARRSIPLPPDVQRLLEQVRDAA